jgi:alkylhydroperoxidase/carboxymuconolactone decarboxylase family protein YurZ
MSTQDSPVDPKTCRLLDLTAAAVLGDWKWLAELRKQAPAGEPDRAWRETLLQCHLFAGYPRVVEAFETLSRHGGMGAVPAEESEAEGDLARGRELFETIYADLAPEVEQRLGEFHPDLARWISEHAYGRVLSRPGLEPHVRELCAVAALTVTGQARQLASHVRGAVRLGSSKDALRAVLSRVEAHTPPEAMERARACVEQFGR